MANEERDIYIDRVTETKRKYVEASLMFMTCLARNPSKKSVIFSGITGEGSR